MAGDNHELASQFDSLSGRLSELEARVTRLEIAERPAAASPAEISQLEDAGATDEPELNVALFSMVGRTLIVLGGGYLLRVLTDDGFLPKLAGVMVGLAYAFIWLGLADRDARRDRRSSAFFHGLTASLIAFPLIWETTARFKLIGPSSAALALGAVAIASLVVSVRGKLGSLAWTAAAFASATAWALLFKTGDPLPFALTFLVLVIGCEWLASHEQSPWVRWLPALALDGVLLVMAQLLLRPAGIPEHYVEFSRFDVFALGQALLLAHLTSTAVRTVYKRQSLVTYDVAQTALSMLVGFGTLGLLSPAASALRQVSGVSGLVLAMGGYALAFGVVRPREGLSPTFFYFSTAAAALALIGSYALLGGRISSPAWLTIAVLALWLGARYDRITLQYHGAVYLIIGATGAGIFTGFSDGMLAVAQAQWKELSRGPVVALIIAGIGYGVLLNVGRKGASTDDESRWRVVPRLILASLLGWTLACAGAGFVGKTLAVAQSPGADAALLATVRTAALVALAVLCAWVGRTLSLRELRWLVWPTLAAAGLKLLREDFRHGRPLTLCLALVLYGGALILVPKLLRVALNHEGREARRDRR